MRYGIEEDWQKKLRRYFMDYIVRWVVVAGVSAVSYWIFQLMPQTNFLPFHDSKPAYAPPRSFFLSLRTVISSKYWNSGVLPYTVSTTAAKIAV